MWQAIAQTTLTMWFFVIAMVGTFFMIASLLFGHDHEVDHDVDHDVSGHEVDHGGGSNLSFLSFKVLMMFVTGFGCSGYLGSFAGFGVVGSSLWGLFGGLVMGAFGYVVMNFLYKRQGSSVVKIESAVGLSGIVRTEIGPNQTGEIVCLVAGRQEYFSARSRSNVLIRVDSEVKIVGVAGPTLVVEPVSFQ